MTCIVGVIHNKKVYIGGDSAGVSGLDVTIRKDKKVFKVGKFIFGCTTSFRMIQLLQFSFKPPPVKDMEVFEYMCTLFATELRKCFSEGGFLTTNNGADEGGTFLVGYKDRLFEIGWDFQVGESTDSYNCCGCGVYYAKGALFALKDNIKPKEKIKMALDAASYLSGGVMPPYHIVNT